MLHFSDVLTTYCSPNSLSRRIKTDFIVIGCFSLCFSVLQLFGCEPEGQLITESLVVDSFQVTFEDANSTANYGVENSPLSTNIRQVSVASLT